MPDGDGREPSDPGQEKTPGASTGRSSPDMTPLRIFCWGMLHALGMFEIRDLTSEERPDGAEEKAWFSIGEVVKAGMLAATIATPAGLWLATGTGPALAFTAAAILYLPLFVFLPKLIRQAMRVDTDAILDAFGKNEQARKVFWTLFITLAGLVLAQIADPALVEKVLGVLAGLTP